MMDWACKVPAFEDNTGLLRRLIVAMTKKRDIISRLEIQ